MKIDFSQVLYTLKGKPYYEPRMSVVADSLDRWMNETYKAHKENDIIKLTTLLDQIVEPKEPKELTLGFVCIEALLEIQEDNRKMNPSEKLKLSELARKIYNAAEPVEMTTKELNLVLERINKNIVYGSSPIIYEQIDKLINLVKETNKE